MPFSARSLLLRGSQRAFRVPAKWGSVGWEGGFHGECPDPAKRSHFRGPIIRTPICEVVEHRYMIAALLHVCGETLGFRGHFWATEAKTGSIWDQNVSFLGDFGPFLGHFRGPFVVTLGDILGSSVQKKKRAKLSKSMQTYANFCQNYACTRKRSALFAYEMLVSLKMG